MSNEFSVDPEALLDAATRMEGFERFVDSMLDEVEKMVADLHLTWSGEGATAQAEAHRKWSHGAAMMREALARLKSAGQIAHHNYTGAAETNRTMWS